MITPEEKIHQDLDIFSDLGNLSIEVLEHYVKILKIIIKHKKELEKKE